MQEELDFGPVDEYRKRLLGRTEQEERDYVLNKSIYADVFRRDTTDRMTKDDALAYMRDVISSHYKKPCSLPENQLFPVYKKLQDQEISRRLQARIDTIESRVAEFAQMTESAETNQRDIGDVAFEVLKQRIFGYE